jgi:antitoxin ParD1/3/4
MVEKLSISLPPDLLRDVRESVESGEFSSTSEAMRDAIRIWKRTREEDAERLSVIRARIRRSLDDSRPNLTSEDVAKHLAELFAKAQQAGGNARSES